MRQIKNLWRHGIRLAIVKVSKRQALLCSALVGSLMLGFIYQQLNLEINAEDYQPICVSRSIKVAKAESSELHQVTRAIDSFCPNLKTTQVIYYASIVHRESRKYGCDWKLIVAIMKAESNFDKHAKSHKGAVGLMQLMPNTAEWLSPKLEIEYSGVSSLYDPEYNIKLGVRYLSMMQDKFGDLDKAIVAYNRGPGKLMRELDMGMDPDSVFLERVKAYYSNLKNAVSQYPT